jgi:metal-dependent amidase/aminoacylase/carboxypeptidase family protein
MRLVTNTTTKGTEKPQQLIGGLQGSVVLVFQPAEERLGGAKHVIEDGGLR